jgi:hypothetical protein
MKRRTSSALLNINLLFMVYLPWLFWAQLFWKDLLTPELECWPALRDEHELRFGGLGPVAAGWAVCRVMHGHQTIPLRCELLPHSR